ncbi:MAG: hypothetical protein IJB84_07035, partial [Lachnospiraceae bacterium]|nr:hypothetical protein [Lachnospiraceae bacterium]
MFLRSNKHTLSLLLAISLILSGIPFPGSVNVVSATETETEAPIEGTEGEESGSETTGIITVIDETWDGAATGAPSAGTNYSYQFGSGLEAYQQSIKVISKNSVVDGAAEGDNCLEIPYTHSAG